MELQKLELAGLSPFWSCLLLICRSCSEKKEVRFQKRSGGFVVSSFGQSLLAVWCSSPISGSVSLELGAVKRRGKKGVLFGYASFELTSSLWSHGGSLMGKREWSFGLILVGFWCGEGSGWWRLLTWATGNEDGRRVLNLKILSTPLLLI
ncbi:hypothetical protein KY285_029965 [Solanum tuberosum]|nr:hypothetical protein KY285_029965 [Solanum tuberosum]